MAQGIQSILAEDDPGSKDPWSNQLGTSNRGWVKWVKVVKVIKKKKELEFPVEGQNPDGQMASPGSCSAHTTWVCQPHNCSTHV